MLFKGKGTRTKIKPIKGMTHQWGEKGSYRAAHVARFIEQNLRPGEKITKDSEWRVLVLDKYEAHTTEMVQKAALKKKYITLVIPGGLTGDIQVCDTDLNMPLKAAYKKQEKAWLAAQLHIKRFPPKESTDPTATGFTPTRELMMQWAKNAYTEASSLEVNAFQPSPTDETVLP